MRRTPLLFNSAKASRASPRVWSCKPTPADAFAIAGDKDKTPTFRSLRSTDLRKSSVTPLSVQPFGATNQDFCAADIRLLRRDRRLQKNLSVGKRHTASPASLANGLAVGGAVFFRGSTDAQ